MTEHRDPVREDRLRTAAKAVLACGVGNLVGDKYRRRVEAFDALDDALDEAAPRSEPLDVERLRAAIEAELAFLPDKLTKQFDMGAAAAYYWCLAALAPSEPTDG